MIYFCLWRMFVLENSEDPDKMQHSTEFLMICQCLLEYHFNPKPLIIFCYKKIVCLLCLLHIFKWTTENFYQEANTMNPDQTAPKRAVWSGSILFAIGYQSTEAVKKAVVKSGKRDYKFSVSHGLQCSISTNNSFLQKRSEILAKNKFLSNLKLMLCTRVIWKVCSIAS